MTRRQAKKLMKIIRLPDGGNLDLHPWRAHTEERLYRKLRRSFWHFGPTSPLQPWYTCNRLCSRAFRALALRGHRRGQGFGSSTYTYQPRLPLSAWAPHAAQPPHPIE